MTQKWLPTNTTEYLFYDDEGLLTINEEQVKALNNEFTSLMKSIYVSLSKKYEEVVKNIVTDADLDMIDFPLIAVAFNIEKLSGLLTPALVEKLNITDDDEISNTEAPFDLESPLIHDKSGKVTTEP